MLEQEKLISRVRELAKGDAAVSAVMMYGSFTQEAGDEYSDVEFYIFVDDLAAIDRGKWVAQVAPYYAFFENEFGTDVAIFTSLIRGEFHFRPTGGLPAVSGFHGQAWFPDVRSMCLYDRDGALWEQLKQLETAGTDRAKYAQSAVDNLLNNLVYGASVLRRGDYAHSHMLLWYVQRFYIQLVRIAEGKTHHWINPTKELEREISADAYVEYARLTAPLDDDKIEEAYLAALDAFRAVRAALEKQGVTLRGDDALLTALSEFLSEIDSG